MCFSPGGGGGPFTDSSRDDFEERKIVKEKMIEKKEENYGEKGKIVKSREKENLMGISKWVMGPWVSRREAQGVHSQTQALSAPALPPRPAARWSTTLSSKVNLPHVINFGAFCGANLVTYPPELWGNETFVLHRVVA